MTFETNGRPARTEIKKRVDVDKQRDDPSSFDISEEERAEIRAKAREMVQAEVKKQKEASLLDEFLKEERQAHVPAKRLIPVFLQLAGSTSYIMLDGTQYYHDNVYHVTPSVAAVLMEQVSRGWAHEEITQVQDAKSHRRHTPPPGMGFENFTGARMGRQMSLRPGMESASSEQLMGVRSS